MSMLVICSKFEIMFEEIYKGGIDARQPKSFLRRSSGDKGSLPQEVILLEREVHIKSAAFPARAR
jgi:hypothetical protein